ncbi:DNA helicase [Arthrobacter sp. 9AX]|uniref:HelD family protein n=1 Tax=Arthrobacter sp. 9AX TaxID=2653131 RepID=UPI0012F29258|nr:UvrD-helicase domain-containing protein [Arthrobacter sp. 9AX]VXC54346.1 DNA helicase [Arthrobacter sp. 9AX]
MSVDTGVGNLSKATELQLEQTFFDRAKLYRDGQNNAWSMAGASAGTAVERRAYKNAMEKRKIASPEDPVALTRIDYEDGDKLYIGKVAIFDEEKNLLVVNWQAPAAAVANQASVHDPLGLRRKRVFHAPANKISSFEDIVYKVLAEAVSELDDHSYAGDALLQSLTRKRGSEMTDIVKTIQAAQDRLVRADKDQLLIIQGGPGTGKTAVALHRVSWLLFNYQDELPPEDVLVVGPNPTFTRYIRRVLPDLGDDDVVQQALQNLLSNEVQLTGTDSRAVAAVKGSARMSQVLERALKQRIRVPSEDIRIQRRNTVLTVSVPASSIAEVLKTLQFDSFASGRRRFRQRLVELCAPQLGNIRQVSPEQFLDLRALDAEVEKIWPQITPQQFLRELLGSRERMKRAAEGHLAPDEMELLYRQQAEKVSDEPWTTADLALLDEAQAAMREAPRTYGHIVVDEAQDLSKMQLRAIRRRSKNGSMTVVGDIAQSTGPYSRDSWDDIAAILGEGTPAQVTSQIAELEHGYRVPKQVFDVALPILQSAAPSVTPPRILRDVEYAPRFAAVPAGELAEEVARTVFMHSGRGRFVGVVAPVQLWSGLREAFRTDDLQWSESTEGELSTAINLVTPEDAKGLEFDAVIVVDPASILDMPHGERMLYIALTRTTTHLDVIYPSGSLPKLLGGSEDETFEAMNDERAPDIDVPVVSTTSSGPHAEAAAAESPRTAPADPALVAGAAATLPEASGEQAQVRNEMASLDGMQQAMAVHWAKFFSAQLTDNVPAKLVPAVLEELARMKLDDRA